MSHSRARIRVCIIALFFMGSIVGSSAMAQTRTRPARIGALTASWGPTPSIFGLRNGLLELGYREDEDFVLGVRFTQGDIDALPDAARQLVQYGVDLLFTSEDAPAKAAQQATSQIPIVFTVVSDPVEMGLIQSFARPGGNITGVTELSLQLAPKRLQIFQEMIPHLKRVLFPYNANEAHIVKMARVYREAARHLGMELVERPVHTTEEARAALLQVHKGEVDGILQPSSLSLNLPGQILEVSRQQGIPTMFEADFWVERGALVSYGPEYYGSGRQAARLVDKILKGAKPADIPVEVNPKIEFAINLKVAKDLGLSIPLEVLYQADRIIR
jgi:putative ABC transport system substrate-binding protein